ncbi:MAG TPA: helix-turn-helix transcriptional regulator, partial [Tepidisphaeraceae bacterium]|nr:helix-turn-helix transcriptional regulator [Tepidisphaeraceae bacterium]
LSVQDVADHVGVGRRTLERRFSGLLGRSPGEEIPRWRLRHAQQLLTRTNEKISRIACRCGFSDAKAFRASFRAAYGCLPAAYRNDVRPTLTHAAPSLTQTPP